MRNSGKTAAMEEIKRLITRIKRLERAVSIHICENTDFSAAPDFESDACAAKYFCEQAEKLERENEY